MTTQLEDLVRRTLADHAPRHCSSADWATLRARAPIAAPPRDEPLSPPVQPRSARSQSRPRGARHRRVRAKDRATIDDWLAVAAHGWTVSPAVDATPVLPVQDQPLVPVPRDVVEAALSFVRSADTAWSTGPATDETIELALGTLMASDLVTDDSAQPQVLWSSEDHAMDASQGPQAMVAVEQPGGWVVGYWSERHDQAVTTMTFGMMPGGPIVDRFVGLAIEGEDLGVESARHIVYVSPVGSTRVAQVLDAEAAEYSRR